MKTQLIPAGLLALGLSAFTAQACLVQVHVACPNDRTVAGIQVCIDGVGCSTTDGNGIASISVPFLGETYTIRIDTTTLPAGATLNPTLQKIKVLDLAPPVVEFVLGGDFCSTPPPPGPCWLTGGGTVDKTKGTPNYSFGGVVYPGCNPASADGGNWNVVDHSTGLHFQGQMIIVDSCSGVATSSPKVNVNVIDFHGLGIIDGIAGNPAASEVVSFVGRAIDNHDGGSGSDMLFLSVSDGGATPVLQVGTSKDNPATITTGNLQIHTSSCQ